MNNGRILDFEYTALLSDPPRLLEETLARRCQKNPRYSLRAFAKSLSIDHSVLSLILARKRALSVGVVQKVVHGLGLNPREAGILLENRKLGSPSSTKKRFDYREIDLDTFELISSWVDYAILSLIENPNTRFESKFIAKKLDIPIILAKASIERLKRLGLVEKKSGSWKQTGKPIIVENSISTPAARQYQHQVLEKSIQALENIPFSIRDFSTTTIAIDPTLVPHARRKIREFRRALTRELEQMSSPKKKEVYKLSVQIFPVSKVNSGGKK